MLFPEPDLHCPGLWHFGDFRNIFLPKIGEEQKKFYHLSAKPLAGIVPCYGKSGLSYCITFMKRLREGLK